MLDNGVESSSEGIHRIHRTRYDSDGKGPCSIRGRLRKSYPMLDEGGESLSDGIHRIHLTRTDYDGKVYVLFVRYLKKLHPCWLSL